MAPIANTEPPTTESAALQRWRAVLDAVHHHLDQQAAHPARCIVLLPYAQLVPVAAQLWAAQYPDGYAPRFETTRSWAARAGHFVPGPTDIAFDPGRDLLTAASLLEGAGLGDHGHDYAGTLLEQALQLSQVASSIPPALRPAWADMARSVLPPLGDGPMRIEAALGRIAVAWASASDYATDVLFTPRVARDLDALVIVAGLQSDPLATTLADHYFEKTAVVAAAAPGDPGQVHLHACTDAADEADRAAACVLAHLAAGRAPVALAAGDRVLTRRISALLQSRGVRLLDETGWKLSTTHAAACVAVLLRASAWGASTDAVLDWLKTAPQAAGDDLRALEKSLRRNAMRNWDDFAAQPANAADHPLVARAQAWRQGLQSPRRLVDWLASLQTALQDTGVWPALQADAAGQALIEALGLAPAEDGGGDSDWAHWPAAQRRMRLAEFTRWASDTLESASFRPPHQAGAQVVVLPLSQIWGRAFAAVVVPGADEQRLPAAPEPTGPWTEAQRTTLRLPTRPELRALQQAAWQTALAMPQVDVLWRHSDDSGEPLLPSPLVQALRLAGQGQPGGDHRLQRAVAARPVAPPTPVGAALPSQPLSASAYDMLRACPYRFFALRQLGLQEDGELDVDVDKRDYGIWVHDVLHRFHTALQAQPGADRSALMDEAAAQATTAAGLHGGEFLPFAAAWPQLKDGYLAWLAGYEAQTGAVFEAAEHRTRRQVGDLALHGTFDRLDRLPHGSPMVIDYKTESPSRTKDRIKHAAEDTQLPFYALLTGAEAPQAAYLNVSEREPVSLHQPPDLTVLAADLHAGMSDDLARIAAGHPLRALGEGGVCDWCAARGLCRKDFWSV